MGLDVSYLLNTNLSIIKATTIHCTEGASYQFSPFLAVLTLESTDNEATAITTLSSLTVTMATYSNAYPIPAFH